MLLEYNLESNASIKCVAKQQMNFINILFLIKPSKFSTNLNEFLKKDAYLRADNFY